MEKYYFLIDSMGWWGAERVVSNLIKKFSQQWKEIYLFTLWDDLFYDIPKEVHYIPLSKIRNSYILFFLIPFFSLKLKYLIKKYWLNDGISFLEGSNYVHILSKKNATISLRIHINIYKWITWTIQKFFIRRLYPKAGKIIVNSRENKYYIAKFLNISKDKIDVQYNPIDKVMIKKLSQEKIEKNILMKVKNKKVFITTWRLVWQKHHEKIINMLYKYDKNNKNWIYLIVWDWPERLKLEKMVNYLWLKDKIIFLWQQKNVFKYLKIGDVFLYASEIEWFPNALLEAREMQLKIISSDFKSWAREVILWEDTDTIGKDIIYPFYWKYWILISSERYEQCINELETNKDF